MTTTEYLAICRTKDNARARKVFLSLLTILIMEILGMCWYLMTNPQ